MEYMELANDMEFSDIRAEEERGPPSIEEALGAIQFLLSV
jgi:hypothetical protein